MGPLEAGLGHRSRVGDLFLTKLVDEPAQDLVVPGVAADPLRRRVQDPPGAIVALTDRDGLFGVGGAAETEPSRLTWSYADDRANDGQSRDPDVDRAVARLFAARARQEAVQRNRTGDYDGARRILDATAKRIRGYAAQDQVLRVLIDELREEQVTYAAPMAEPSLKRAHFASANMLHSRDAAGRSVKRG